MADTEYSRQIAELFFVKHDPALALRGFRNFIPGYVLQSFCDKTATAGEPNMWVVYEENQMHLVGNADLLTIFDPEHNEFDKLHWSTCFGQNDIYTAYFDNISSKTFQQSGFSKLLTLQRVDSEIYSQIADSIWHVRGNQSIGQIPFSREDIYNFRKYLYLMTSLGNRERNMHLLAHHEFMENARLRRRKFVENNSLEHVRDVWLKNAERILDVSHSQIPNTTTIFDLDRNDYRANAIERYMVFWEAGPNEEFVLTDSGFGGFEGGQIGAKKNSKINMTPLELENHLYTRDFMWHQIYVLSPTLVVALCHPSLMHPELINRQRKRWGLRKSLLESLPHDVPHRYYKDMKKSEMSFSAENWPLPVEVEKMFSAGGRGYERRQDEDVVFPIHRLTAGQVALVNSVLLHNQELGPKIKSVCIRPSFQSFYQSLRQFQNDPWDKYSEETQNDYEPLIQRLESYLSAALPPTPPNIPANYPYQPLPSNQMFDSRPSLGNMHYTSLSTGDVPRYDDHFDPGLPMHLQAHSSTQSSLTSFAPSSQSSYSHSSTSSQSSATASTKTTSIDTPRFETKRLEHHRHRSPSRGRGNNQDRNLSNSSGSVQRSNTSGKSQRSKAEKAKNLNIVIEKTLQEANNIHAMGGNVEGYLSAIEGHYYNGYQPVPGNRGRNPEPVRSQPSSNPSSKRTSPNPPRAEALAPPPPAHGIPTSRNTSSNGSGIPEKKNYASDSSRPNIHRARTEAQTVQVARTNTMQYVPELQAPPQRRPNRSPERIYVPELAPPAQPPHRGQVSPENPSYSQSHRSQPKHTEEHRAEPQPSTLVDARGRRYEPVRPEPAVQQERAAPAQQVIIDSVRDRLHQVINSEAPTRPQRNRSPERRQEQQRSTQAQTANGNVYQMVAPSQPPTRTSQPSGTTQAPPPPPPHQAQQQQVQAPPQQPPQRQITQEQPQVKPQPQPQPQQQQPQIRVSASTNTSTSTEHSIRPGVEIVRGRSLNSSTTSSQPSNPSKTSSAPVDKADLQALVPIQSYQEKPANPVVKQLRFETPTKTVTHKYSDLSLAGSMLVHTGDSPSLLCDYDDDDEDDDTTSEGSTARSSEHDTESEGEGGNSWEDENLIEEMKNSRPTGKQRVVRFADKPLPSPKLLPMALARRGADIERPNSRLGRRVEIPRPLSRTGHNARFPRRRA